MSTEDLCVAASQGDVKAVRSLLKSLTGTQVNGQDSSKNTALYKAASLGHEQVLMELLSSKEIDVNARSAGGNTALHGTEIR